MHNMPIDFSNDAPKRLNGDAPKMSIACLVFYGLTMFNKILGG